MQGKEIWGKCSGVEGRHMQEGKEVDLDRSRVLLPLLAPLKLTAST